MIQDFADIWFCMLTGVICGIIALAMIVLSQVLGNKDLSVSAQMYRIAGLFLAITGSLLYFVGTIRLVVSM